MFKKESIRETRELIHRCQGPMLVLLLLFYILKNYVVIPLIKLVWSLALSTMPIQYITDKNITNFLRSPLCIITLLFIVAFYCVANVWELSSIILCFDYYANKKPANLLHILKLSIKNISHLWKPKNWLFFVFVIVIMPYVDIFSTSGMVKSIAIPEYIQDTINSILPLKCALIALVVFMVYLCIRWFFVMQGVLLCHKDFKAACKDSAYLMKGRTIRQLVDVAMFSIYQLVTLCLIPLLAALAIALIEKGCMGGFESFVLCGSYTVDSFFIPIFSAVVSIFMRMSISCYMLIAYLRVSKEKDLAINTYLPEYGVKHGKIRKFKFLKPAALSLAIIIPAVFCPIFVMAVENDPTLADTFKSDIQIAAHKGYSSQAPENTMPAFEKALSCGKADYIELDIRESKDGIPIVIHNASLNAATGVKQSVYSLDYDEIRSQCAKYHFSAKKFPDAYVPTLEEVLQTYGNKIKLLIEIKMSPKTPDLPKKIVDLINKYDCKENCIIHSGSYDALEAVKAVDSSIPCGYIVAFGTGSFYKMPCADFFSIEHTFVDQSLVDMIHSLGKQIYVWTVNEEKSISDAVDLGVDMIITDYPEYVYDYLHSYDQIVDSFIHKSIPSDLLEAVEETPATEEATPGSILDA